MTEFHTKREPELKITHSLLLEIHDSALEANFGYLPPQTSPQNVWL